MNDDRCLQCEALQQEVDALREMYNARKLQERRRFEELAGEIRELLIKVEARTR